MTSVAVISDLHHGSHAALWPEHFSTSEGVQIDATPAQRIMLDYWHDFWDQPEVKDCEYIFNLAESIEGNNRKGFGKALMVADLDTQISAAEQNLKEVIGDRYLYMVEGSLYHSGLDVNVEKALCDKLGGEYLGQIGNVEISGKVINAAHKAGNAAIYKSTMLDRNSLFADAVEGTKLDWHIDAVIRGHHHQYFLNDNESRLSLLAPCWTFWHPIPSYGAGGYFNNQPTVGGIVLEIGRCITVRKFLYPIIHIFDALRKGGKEIK